MNSLVFKELATITKCLLAHVTNERFETRVDISMSVQIADTSKAFVTQIAFIRLHPDVNKFMSVKMVQVFKHPMTNITFV